MQLWTEISYNYMLLYLWRRWTLEPFPALWHLLFTSLSFCCTTGSTFFFHTISPFKKLNKHLFRSFFLLRPPLTVTTANACTVLVLYKGLFWRSPARVSAQNLFVGRCMWALGEVAFWLMWAEWLLSSMCVGVMASSLNLEGDDWEGVSVCVATHLFSWRTKCKCGTLDNATSYDQWLHLHSFLLLSR